MNFIFFFCIIIACSSLFIVGNNCRWVMWPIGLFSSNADYLINSVHCSLIDKKVSLFYFQMFFFIHQILNIMPWCIINAAYINCDNKRISSTSYKRVFQVVTGINILHLHQSWQVWNTCSLLADKHCSFLFVFFLDYKGYNS